MGKERGVVTSLSSFRKVPHRNNQAMGATVIRPVRSGEAGRVIELLRQLWPERHLDVVAVSAMVDRYVDDPGYWILGYEDEGVLWGVITISFRWSFFHGGQAAIIEDLVVEGSRRGQGIGRGLVRFVENEMPCRSEPASSKSTLIQTERVRTPSGRSAATPGRPFSSGRR